MRESCKIVFTTKGDYTILTKSVRGSGETFEIQRSSDIINITLLKRFYELLLIEYKEVAGNKHETGKIFRSEILTAMEIRYNIFGS
ncbi:MAG: hypothetical protein ABSC20_07190 [Candidatus Bathyarchaeia archaeon]